MTSTSDPKSLSLSFAGGQRGYNTPASELRFKDMTVDEKRSLLASWASDARAVPDHPALRRLDDGRIVEIDEILDELKRLDASSSLRGSTSAGDWYLPPALSRRARRDLNGPDDDPTTPAPAAPRPRPPVLTDSQALVAA